MSKTYGIDVSRWEGTIDWPTAAQHVNFCIMKATEGTSWVDAEFAANKAGCIANEKPWGAYHFFRPNYDPIAQANHFVNTVGDGCEVYVADVETALLQEIVDSAFVSGVADAADIPGDIKSYRGLAEYPEELKQAIDNALLNTTWTSAADGSITGIVEILKQFLDRVEQLVSKKPMIYTSPGFWNYNMVPTPPWTDDYDLWDAHWGVLEPTLPHGWTSYVIHQYGDSGRIPGIPGACDEDWFNGDLAAVHAYFGLDVPPPETFRIKVAPGYRRAAPICEQPSNTSKIQGYAVHQSMWTADALVTGADGHTYYRINPSGYIMARLCVEL